MSALGLTMTVLATGLAEAIEKDRKGPLPVHEGEHVTAWLREVAGAICGEGRPVVCSRGPAVSPLMLGESDGSPL